MARRKKNKRKLTGYQKKVNKINRAFETYLRNRKKLQDAGYGLQTQTSKKEFKELYQNALDAGVPISTLPRELAKYDKVFSFRQAQAIFKQMVQSEEYYKYGRNARYETAYDILAVKNGHKFIKNLIDRGLMSGSQAREALGY